MAEAYSADDFGPHLSASCLVCGTTGFEARDSCPLHKAAPQLLRLFDKMIVALCLTKCCNCRTEIGDPHSGCNVCSALRALYRTPRPV